MANPIGTITMWSGAIIDIPDGWALCDGTLGTPDLRDRFIPGAGDLYIPGATGGSLTHNHGFFGNGHVHSVSNVDFIGVGVGTEIWHASADGNEVQTGNANGTTFDASTIPLFHALAYIMRLS